jgi:hypothetical protein
MYLFGKLIYIYLETETQLSLRLAFGIIVSKARDSSMEQYTRLVGQAVVGVGKLYGDDADVVDATVV